MFHQGFPEGCSAHLFQKGVLGWDELSFRTASLPQRDSRGLPETRNFVATPTKLSFTRPRLVELSSSLSDLHNPCDSVAGLGLEISPDSD